MPSVYLLLSNRSSKAPQQLVIDYIIHHRKANGTTAPKVFKWKTATLPARRKVTTHEVSFDQTDHHPRLLSGDS